MSSFVTPPTFAAGPLTSTDLNVLRDDINYLKDVLDLVGATSSSALKPLKTRRYGVRLTNSTDITAADSTDKDLSWDNEDVDSSPAFHDPSVPKRITIPSGGDGDYLVGLNVQFATDTDGDRFLWVEKNTTVVSKMQARAATGTQTWMNLVFYIPSLVSGDYLIGWFRHTAGANLDAKLSAGGGQSFWAFRVSAT